MLIFRFGLVTISLLMMLGGMVATVRDFGPWPQLRRILPNPRQRHLDWILVIWGVAVLVGTLFFWSHFWIFELPGCSLFLIWYLSYKKVARRRLPS